MGAKKVDFESLWTIQEVMTYLKMGKTKVTELTKSGKLPSRMIGGDRRYIPEEVRKWTLKQGS